MLAESATRLVKYVAAASLLRVTGRSLVKIEVAGPILGAGPLRLSS